MRSSAVLPNERGREAKTCSACKRNRPLKEFYIRVSRGVPCRFARCRECELRISREWHKAHPEHMKRKSRRNHLKNLYGMTPEEYQEKFATQNGLCAICRKPETKTLRGELISLATDHDHETDRLRDLLCHRCNSLIGLAGEDVAVLEAAIAYLKKHRSQHDISPSRAPSPPPS
jgi:hypothetical protein